MAVFWIYILEIKKKNEMTSYYTGYTNNLTNRIAQHKSGKGARYTKNDKEKKLKYTETFSNQSDDMKREKAIKKLPKVKKKELIESYSRLSRTFF